MSLSGHGRQLLEQELRLFESDYARHYVEGESKPPAIGRPYLLLQPVATTGVLLVHGLMAAPEEVRELAEFLYAEGYTVYAPRMAGHGTSSGDLAGRVMSEWIASVETGHEILKGCCDKIVIAGFSTGAAVALYLVIKYPQAFAAVVSVSAPLKFKSRTALLAAPLDSWNRCLRHLGIKRCRKEFVTNHADNPHINYSRCPVSGIAQIRRLMKAVYRGLPSISIPALIMHAGADPKVDVQSGQVIFQRLGSKNKRWLEIDYPLHGIVRGEIARAVVFKEISRFLQSLASLQRW
jgi:esterase/lipase